MQSRRVATTRLMLMSLSSVLVTESEICLGTGIVSQGKRFVLIIAAQLFDDVIDNGLERDGGF